MGLDWKTIKLNFTKMPLDLSLMTERVKGSWLLDLYARVVIGELVVGPAANLARGRWDDLIGYWHREL